MKYCNKRRVSMLFIKVNYKTIEKLKITLCNRDLVMSFTILSINLKTIWNKQKYYIFCLKYYKDYQFQIETWQSWKDF